MFHINLIAVAKDSSAIYTENAVVSTEHELQEAYHQFKINVPFPRWRSEHEVVDGGLEQEEWIENLE